MRRKSEVSCVVSYFNNVVRFQKIYFSLILSFSIFAVDDASGRYTTGFFYGNNYFTGSLSLCTSIYRDDPQHHFQGMHFLGKTNYIFANCVFNGIFLFLITSAQPKRQKQTGLSFTQTYTANAKEPYHDNPPFFPGFFVIKMLVNETSLSYPVRMRAQNSKLSITKAYNLWELQPRTIFFGMCLPTTCTTDEIMTMAQLSQHRSPFNYEVEILAVRSPTQSPYDYWGDTTFVVLV